MIHFLSRDTKNKQCLRFLVNSVKLEAKFINIYINGNIENLKGYTSTASQVCTSLGSSLLVQLSARVTVSLHPQHLCWNKLQRAFTNLCSTTISLTQTRQLTCLNHT